MNGPERVKNALLRFFNLFPFFDLAELTHQQRVQETVKGEIEREQNFMERVLLPKNGGPRP